MGVIFSQTSTLLFLVPYLLTNHCRNSQYLIVLHNPSLEAISHRLLIAELPNFLSLKNTCTALEYSYKGCIRCFSEKYHLKTDSTLVCPIFAGFRSVGSMLIAQQR